MDVELFLLLDDEPDIMSSSSSSSDEEIFSKVIQLLSPLKSNRITIKKFEEVVANYSDERFQTHLRLERKTYEKIVNLFSNSCISQKIILNHKLTSISAEKHILVFLWFAGHQTASYRDVADRFDLSLSSLYDIISRVSEYLCSIASDIIKFPSEEEQNRTKQFYYNHNGFPNVIGSIDGSHITIDRPNSRATDYFNRKDFHSIILQGICDENMRFINVFIGYPGSVHDARVFKNSDIYESLEELCDGNYILGDSAYPLLAYLITPFRDNGHLDAAQKNFNIKLSSCRVTIEHAFGLLKQKFRQLYHLKLKGHVRRCNFIKACCVLHNLSRDDALIFHNDETLEDIQPETTETLIAQSGSKNIRNEICRQLYLRQ